jgi:hypothetical protein
MQTFLVLGLIPGTNTQITFRVWLNCLGLFVVFLCSAWLHSVRKRASLSSFPLARIPLPASQLHRRVQ